MFGLSWRERCDFAIDLAERFILQFGLSRNERLELARTLAERFAADDDLEIPAIPGGRDCEACGRPLTGRKDMRFCSETSTCRSRAHRQKKSAA